VSLWAGAGVAPHVTASGTPEFTDESPTSETTVDATVAQTPAINISVTDSSNGQDSVTVPITVGTSQSDGVPTDLPDSVSDEQYNAWAGDDGEITQGDAINGFNGWFNSNDGNYNGVAFGQEEALDLFSYWFNS